MSRLSFKPGSSTAYRTGDWATQLPVYKNKWPPCGQTCPASEDIQAWLALLSDADSSLVQDEAAWRKITERNPLPAVMGRICYHPCELGCNRMHLDSSVNIHSVERYLGDLALEHGWQHQVLTEDTQTQPVAIIGAGPAGLSCAFQLARRGYPVTIFDAQSAAGGTVRNGIPDYRLPKDVLQQEIDRILALGIKLKLDTRIGVQRSAESVQQEFAAIFVAIGEQQPRLYTGGDQSQHSVFAGVDFLRRVNQGESIKLPRQVAVIGGGNTAIDAARCARRMGAEVTVVCPQEPHGSQHGYPSAEMPASHEEVLQAEAEGVLLRYRLAVSRLVRSGEHLSGLEIARINQLHNRHGEFAPLLFEGTEEFLPAGLAIFAIGQNADWQGLESLRDSEESNILIGGDAAGKPRFAATAVGSGYQAAMSIIADLTGSPPCFEQHEKAEVLPRDLNMSYYPRLERQEGGVIAEVLSDFDEINLGLDDAAAMSEAERCLSCGVCFQCDNCWHFCPDAAVIKDRTGYKVDEEFCKGCGICAQECPCGHIDMVPVSL
ncbi:Pyridine nucleotide-disulphide oxidoreductase family protein associated with PFOR [hydrothermal vent metagenome]|uniref:Pyridine nucleotide-disulphide oxidoreductase family protein associated with PFOR n=1 Tax=hydrothermal vent metagenome TaxID=652676 RepID=A0A3B1A713_9ZZZZ